jgi:large subunit ribosomal protein L20
MTYSAFMAALRVSNVALDRKVLADMAVNDSAGFVQLVKSLQTTPSA